jgi:hypothetical protein
MVCIPYDDRSIDELPSTVFAPTSIEPTYPAQTSARGRRFRVKSAGGARIPMQLRVHHPTRQHRLPHRRDLLRLCPRHRLGPEEAHEGERRLPDVGPLHPRLGRRPRVPLGQPGGPGGDRHGGLRRQVRHHDEPLLLGGRHPGHGVPRRLHDAVLLRLEGPLGAGVPEAALRREDPRLQRVQLRRDDDLLLRHLDVRDGEADGLLLGWNFGRASPSRRSSSSSTSSSAASPRRSTTRCSSSS